MSELLDRYYSSKSPRVESARSIPKQETNYFDQPNDIQTEIKNFPELKKTRFTKYALNIFDKKLTEYSLPEGFVPLEPDIPFNRWNPTHRYYQPGQSKG